MSPNGQQKRTQHKSDSKKDSKILEEPGLKKRKERENREFSQQEMEL